MPTTPRPILTIQTASLWASGDNSSFNGTGGPAAFDPFLGEFSDVISSTGLASEPFEDQLYNVDANDQVTFVIAIQNFGTVAAYDIKLRDTLPIGFALTGYDLTVADGAGNALMTSGNLFDPNSGMTITSPLAPFDSDSGANVAIVTFTAYATNQVALPNATVTNAAQILSYAASSGGASLAGSSNTILSASTPVQTGNFTVQSAADQPAATLNAGHTASFDITVTLPEGSTQDLRIDQVLPQIGTSWLQLVSAQIVSFGSHLSASAPVAVQPSGSIQLGTVVNAADNLITSADQIVVRVTVRGGGTTAGSGTINTVVSTADPNGGAARVSTTLSNTLTLGPADIAPIITGTSAGQFATNSMLVLPFQTLVLTDPDVAQVQTLTIHMSAPALGVLSGPVPLAANAAGDYVLTGPVQVVQSAARMLLFTPTSTATGTEIFALTLDDGAGGVDTGQAALTVAPAAHPAASAHFPISPQTVLTSTATGSSTYSQVETYRGAISNLDTQFLYDGDTTLAIVAQQDGMLISSQAQATAIQLQGGVNVLDMQHGSSFMVSGTGSDTFLLHADQPQATWNTIVNFHAGDTIVVYGFTVGASARWWDDNAGAAGYRGATLRIDVDGNQSIDSSLTFAGKTSSDVAAHFSIQSGNVGGSGFLSITTS